MTERERIKYAKDYLNQAYYIDRKIKLDTEKLEAMKAALYGKGNDCQNDGSQHTLIGNSIESALVKVLEYEEQINAEINNLVHKRIEIEDAIKSVDGVMLQEILFRRYLQFQKWDDIAIEIGKEVRWVYRLHNRALKKIKIDH